MPKIYHRSAQIFKVSDDRIVIYLSVAYITEFPLRFNNKWLQSELNLLNIFMLLHKLFTVSLLKLSCCVSIRHISFTAVSSMNVPSDRVASIYSMVFLTDDFKALKYSNDNQTIRIRRSKNSKNTWYFRKFIKYTHEFQV